MPLLCLQFSIFIHVTVHANAWIWCSSGPWNWGILSCLPCLLLISSFCLHSTHTYFLVARWRALSSPSPLNLVLNSQLPSRGDEETESSCSMFNSNSSWITALYEPVPSVHSSLIQQIVIEGQALFWVLGTREQKDWDPTVMVYILKVIQFKNKQAWALGSRSFERDFIFSEVHPCLLKKQTKL